MLAYLARRITYALIMVVLVSFVGFLIIDLPPGDFLTQKLAELQSRGDRSAELRIAEYRARYGLDKPLLTRYWIWATHFITGDFGESFQYERPVSDLLSQRLMMTAVLAIATLAITWLVAIPIGVYSAVHQYSLGDQIFTTISFIGLGMPGFLLALIILFFAAVILKQDIGGLFSRQYQDAPWSIGKVIDLLKHLWIPALIGSVTGAAGLIRIMRGNLLDTLGQPFVEAARARGLPNRTVVWKHAVRVAINPLIVILGSEALPSIIGGNALVAMVLNLPTTGPLFVQALQTQDMYLAGTGLVFYTIFLLIGNLLADLALAWADPRIRLG
ncbi:MAG: ABC transporter permease [Anaerolineae bacterium]|nr:ABC transporter permease [Anaerolineae bacterium]